MGGGGCGFAVLGLRVRGGGSGRLPSLPAPNLPLACPPASASLPPLCAAETGLLYFETSAKANINVIELFDEVADK